MTKVIDFQKHIAKENINKMVNDLCSVVKKEEVINLTDYESKKERKRLLQLILDRK